MPSNSPIDLPSTPDETRDANLIRATTDLYVQEAVHDRDETRRFEELASHLLPRISVADRAYVSERLADRRDAPASIIRLLARDVIDVAAPILSTSPVLDTLTMLSTIAATDAEHHRIIARRKDLPDQVRRALRLTADEEVLGALEGTARAPRSSSPAIDPIVLGAFRHGANALREAHRSGGRFLELSRRDRLAVLIDYATRPAAPPSGGVTNRLDRAFRSILGAAKIVGFARAKQRTELLAAIADGLDIDAGFVEQCLNDAGGEALVVLLKALRLDSVQAQTVLLLATPSGKDTALFFPLADLYAGMEGAVAEAIVDAWRGASTGRRSGHQPYVAGDEQSRAAAAQTTRIAPAAVKQGDQQKRA